MMYSGSAFCVKELQDGFVELIFDHKNESVNKLNKVALDDLQVAVAELESRQTAIKGLVLCSAKSDFIVGADVTEFTEMFALEESEIASWLMRVNSLFARIEDLSFPTVCSINGYALGGGLELALCADYRVMAETATIGLPEVKLGIFPGFGGTVRMSRLIGVDNALEWIGGAGQHGHVKALADGVVDAVVSPDLLREAALNLLKLAVTSKLDYQAKRTEKTGPLGLPPMEMMMAFQTGGAVISQKAGKHYPAPIAAVKAMQKHAGLERDEALEVEAKAFAVIAKTAVAANLTQLFLNDQALKKMASTAQKQVGAIELAAVLGAGIMGGGIAYQSAYKGTPILLKDITEEALTLGMSEATTLLNKRVSRKRMTTLEMAEVLTMIRPTLSYGDFETVDVLIEAVVENVKVKKSVLSEVENKVNSKTVIASNTSTISINTLAESLKRPENFLGMHFFNPVHKMPLVEVIRGDKTSDAAVATVVAYAKKMGKTPIVVKDCPGFFVNRVLFPYFFGFSMLMRDGADFQAVDKVMERFGWPMGPAYLMDVVGVDTGVHAAEVMASGFPERMQHDFSDVFSCLFENKRFGQKNHQGFYQYKIDRKGKLNKQVDPVVLDLFKPIVAAPEKFEADVIIARLMIPMCLEVIRCLEEGIVNSVMEADMMLVMGLGFPPFIGGALRYVDSLGAAEFVNLCEQYAHLGLLYKPTKGLVDKARRNETYY